MTPDVLTSVALMPPHPGAQRLSGGDPGPARGLAPELSGDDRAAIRRQLRIRLLRDLVSNGLYQVPTEALADRLTSVVIRPVR